MNVTIISDDIHNNSSNTHTTLANAFKKKGHIVNVILPLYEKLCSISRSEFAKIRSTTVKLAKGSFDIDIYKLQVDDVCYYFIASKLFSREKNWGYSDDALRLMVFCTASIELLINNDTPINSVITNSPNTALIPVLLKLKYHINTTLRNIKSYHYINYNCNTVYDRSVISTVFGLSPDEKHIMLSNNEADLTKAAIICSSRIFVGENSVSLLYDRNNALHHTIVQFGFKIRKIRLGIDYNIFSPDNDGNIKKAYSSEHPTNKTANKLYVQKHLHLKENEDIPLVVIYQNKRNDIWHKYMHELIRCDIQLIIISDKLRQADMPAASDKCVYIQDRGAITLKNIFSAAEYCIFGCLDSECGNPSFISASYGCIPIISGHRFYDHGFEYFNKLTLDGNGYTYDPDVSKDMMYTLWDALGVFRHDKRTYRKLLCNTMKKVFSASDSIEVIEKEHEKTIYSFI